MFYAHSTPRSDRSDWQALPDHLTQVANLAAGFGRKFGAGKAAALAGILHDLGKYTPEFQRRLAGGDRVDHATAGAQEIDRLVPKPGWDRLVAQLLAYGIAGHHAGLPDGQAETGSLADRLKKTITPPDAVWRRELTVDATGLLPSGFTPDRGQGGFQFGFLGRMLFSCLVDADYRDTEAFYARSEGRVVDRAHPALSDMIDGLIARFDLHMATKRGGGPVNALRDAVLNHVRGQAAAPTGLFTLTVPTGGGKTLASLGFALDHAKRHGLDRIIYAIPFTSVIDQTAAIFQTILGEEIVLEHHSAIEEDRFCAREGRDKLKLAMEDWAVPVVVTTNVQLFESLFANRPGRCRKLHNLARAVIVLDEAQTIPLPVLRPCVAALNQLSRHYGSSIVLCTATQPALSAPNFVGGFDAVRELAPDPLDLSARLRRVTMRRAGIMTDDQLLDELAEAPQGLIILNSRAHALALYRQATRMGLTGILHLTTRQYAAHRRLILAELRRRLKAGEPCRLIATSLVEAGVDLDFPRVWRAEAGLDQIAQAAGRCNREGLRPIDESVVTVFRPADHRPPREIAQLAEDFARIAGRHGDILSLDAIRDYFDEVYWRKDAGLDAQRVLDAFKLDARGADCAYRRVAENFKLIESGLAPVIIARDQLVIDAICEVSRENISSKVVSRRIQPYIVQVPPKARAQLLAGGHLRFEAEQRFAEQFAVLQDLSLYRDDVGLVWEDAGGLGCDNLII